jgi:membrane-associated phospholipid phosphatase
MNRNLLIVALLTLILSCPCIAQSLPEEGRTADTSDQAADKPRIPINLFSNLGGNLFNSFIGPTTLMHLGAVATTLVMVREDWDYLIYKRCNSLKKYEPYFTPTIYTGATCWLIVSSPMLIYGLVHKSDETLGAAYSVLQSTLISIVYVTLLKGLTGRPHPDYKWYVNMRKQSRVFRFGFLRGSVFYGWPGGHTMITTATFASLMSYYPDKWWLKVVGFLFIAYTATGMAMTKGHWMSDNIAGFLMGYAIGSAVGKSFRTLVNRKLGIAGDQVEFVPAFGFSSAGMQVTLHF